MAASPVKRLLGAEHDVPAAARSIHDSLFRKAEIRAIGLSSANQTRGTNVETRDGANGYNPMGRGVAGGFFLFESARNPLKSLDYKK